MHVTCITSTLVFYLTQLSLSSFKIAHHLSWLGLCAKVIIETYPGKRVGRSEVIQHNQREKDAKTHNSETGPCCPYT